MPKQFPLEIVIGATDKATAKLKAIQDRISGIGAPVRRLSRSFAAFSQQSGLTRVGSEVAVLGSRLFALGAAGVAAGAGMAALALRSSQAADELGDTAARLNISTDALQAWTYGFGQADVEQQAFSSSLDTLNKNLGDAQIGMGRAVRVFQGLGIDPKKFKTVDQLLPTLADRLSKISNPAKRAAIAQRLLGEAGAQMALELGRGPKALRDMEDAFRRVGGGIDRDVIESAGELDQKLKSLKATFSGVAGNVLGRLYPALTKIAGALQESIIKYRPQLEAFAAVFAERLPGYVERTLDAFDQLTTALAPMASAIGWLFETFGVGNTVVGAFAILIGGKLIIALSALAANLVTLGVAMGAAFWPVTAVVVAVAAAVAAGWYLYRNWDRISAAIKQTISDVGAWFSSVWQGIKTAAIAAFDAIWAVVKNHPLLLAMRGVGFIVGKIGGAFFSQPQASPQSAAGGPLGSSLFNAAKQPPQRVEVSVGLSNLPAGTRTEARGSDGIDLGLSRGFVMPGVR